MFMVFVFAIAMFADIQTTAAADSVNPTATVSTDTEIQPRDVVNLTTFNGLEVQKDHPVTITVTPKAHSNLKFVGNVHPYGGICKIEVTKNGGWWPSKTILVKPGDERHIYDLINDGNGESYTVKISQYGDITPTSLFGYLTQSDSV